MDRGPTPTIRRPTSRRRAMAGADTMVAAAGAAASVSALASRAAAPSSAGGGGGGGGGGGWGWRGWGGWGHNSYTTINVNRATSITNNFNRNYYHDDHWNHDPAHRHGVPYRDQASRDRYDQHHPDAAQRQAFRGKIDHDP